MHSKSFETLGLEKYNCPLCGCICSLHHILSNCTVALINIAFDQNANVVKEQLPHISTSFVPAGKAPTKTKIKTYSGLIAGSNDWKLLLDLPDSSFGHTSSTRYCNLVRKTSEDLID